MSEYKAAKYDVRFFPNGRIVFVPWEDIDNAINNNKEVLVICNAWSGGYAIAIGANEVPASWYDPSADPDKIAFEMYSYNIKDTEFTSEEFARFHKVIVSSGTMVRMKTGEQANSYQGSSFVDWDTSYDKFGQSFRYNNETEEEFEKLRFQIDISATARYMRHCEDYNEKLRSLSHYSMFSGIDEWVE